MLELIVLLMEKLLCTARIVLIHVSASLIKAIQKEIAIIWGDIRQVNNIISIVLLMRVPSATEKTAKLYGKHQNVNTRIVHYS